MTHSRLVVSAEASRQGVHNSHQLRWFWFDVGSHPARIPTHFTQRLVPFEFNGKERARSRANAHSTQATLGLGQAPRSCRRRQRRVSGDPPHGVSCT